MDAQRWSYSGAGRRYNAWTDFCREKYGGRVQKVAVDAGFTCPNRDGTVSEGGCAFCNNEGFNPSYCRQGSSISDQIDQGLTFLKRRYPRSRFFVAYLQAYSNTHAELSHLKKIYSEALSHDFIEGLVIATRPDCIDVEKLDYLKELSQKYYIKIEYGIESCHDSTLLRVNRGHTWADSVRAIQLTAERGLPVGGHLLFGLPGETREMMLAQAGMINSLPLQSIKFHQLQIVDGTAMADEYGRYPDRFKLFQLDDYLSFLVDFIERLRPDMIIERLSGEVPIPLNLGISWGKVRADQVQLRFENLLAERDSFQGKLFQKA